MVTEFAVALGLGFISAAHSPMMFIKPLLGTETLALIVIAGTVLITIGALSIFLALYRKKNGRMPGILLRLLK